MAQTQKPTKLGYGNIGRLVAGEIAGTVGAVKSIVGLTGACTASEDSTFLNPGGATKLAANGFALVNADTVAAVDSGGVVDSIVQLDHVFTCTGDQSVSGFAVENDADACVIAECCLAAALSMEAAGPDTLTCQMKIEFKLGA